MLLSRGPLSREVFAVRRGAHLKFFGGFWAFPGGRLDPADSELARGDALAARRVAACRELFEETGVLVARLPDGSFPAAEPSWQDWRRDLLAGTRTFGELLTGLRLAVRDEDFRHVGQITTPPFSAARFATTFFATELPPGQRADVVPGELDAGRWAECATLLDEWRRGEQLLTPPTVIILQALAGHAVGEAPERLGPLFQREAEPGTLPILFAPGVRVLPLRTRALPPLAYTNTLLVGSGPHYLIDPGPEDPAEQEKLLAVLDEEASAGRPVTAVVLTHHHPDHVGAAAVCARRLGAPVWSHALTAERLRGRVDVDRLLAEGDRLDLGPRPAGGGAWHLDVLHTPGHAPGHLVLFEPFYGVILAADLVSTVTSIVIAPPDGDLVLYLESLRRVRDLPARLLIPAHGNASANPRQTIDGALEHRARREAQLVEALRDGPCEVAELVPRLYRGLHEELLRFARAQVVAGLIKLRGEGRVREAGGRWEWVG